MAPVKVGNTVAYAGPLPLYFSPAPYRLSSETRAPGRWKGKPYSAVAGAVRVRANSHRIATITSARNGATE